MLQVVLVAVDQAGDLFDRLEVRDHGARVLLEEADLTHVDDRGDDLVDALLLLLAEIEHLQSVLDVQELVRIVDAALGVRVALIEVIVERRIAA